jgi:hypothetical protein
LEHLADDYGAIIEWTKMLKVGGYLVLYLPDDRWYNNIGNLEHVRQYTFPVFMRWFKMGFQNLKIVSAGEDYGDDRYSFYLVSQKIGKV